PVATAPPRADAPCGGRAPRPARWVFASRPAAPVSTGRTRLLQPFRGWFVRAPTDLFDPAAAVLMDMRTPQPRRGVAFGYVLPLSRREALVEYTEFGSTALTTAEYECALKYYYEPVRVTVVMLFSS